MDLNGVDNTTAIALISTVGGIITTYLTVKYKDRIIKPKEKPANRMDTIFDGYEKLIKQQQEDIERKSMFIDHLQAAVDRLRKDLDKTESLLAETREELHSEKSRSRQLGEQLKQMKKNYNEMK